MRGVTGSYLAGSGFFFFFFFFLTRVAHSLARSRRMRGVAGSYRFFFFSFFFILVLNPYNDKEQAPRHNIT